MKSGSYIIIISVQSEYKMSSEYKQPKFFILPSPV